MGNKRRWFKFRGLFVCAPPKCGGTALYSAALGIDPKHGNNTFAKAQKKVQFFRPDEITLPALMAVRYPVDRFMSLWRNKCRDGDPHLEFLRGMSPEELLEHIAKKPFANAHWAPQVTWYRTGVELVDYRSMHLRLGLPGARINTTEAHEDDPDVEVADVKALYEEDFELWKNRQR
jgi:hypothetical protein